MTLPRRLPRYRPTVRGPVRRPVRTMAELGQALHEGMISSFHGRWMVDCQCGEDWLPARFPTWETAYRVADDHARVSHKTDRRWRR